MYAKNICSGIADYPIVIDIYKNNPSLIPITATGTADLVGTLTQCHPVTTSDRLTSCNIQGGYEVISLCYQSIILNKQGETWYSQGC